MNSIHHLRIDPFGVLFCRGGRPYTGGSHCSSELPSPQVLCGALRSGLLAANSELPELGNTISNTTYDALMDVRSHGPVLARDVPGEPSELLVPVPADLAWTSKENNDTQQLIRLRPIDDPLLRCQDGRRPLWGPHAISSRRDWQPVSGFLLRDQGLKTYLAGETPSAADLVAMDDLMDWEARSHVGINADSKTAQEGLLFSQQVLRLRPGVWLYAQLHLDTQRWPHLPDHINLGGDRHQAQITSLNTSEHPFLNLLSDCATNPGQEKTLVYHLTPTIFADSQTHSDMPSEWQSRLHACAIPGSLPVSGWDVRKRAPKPTRHAIVAGSVHLLNGNAGAEAAGQLTAQQAGFGWPLLGQWRPWDGQ